MMLSMVISDCAPLIESHWKLHIIMAVANIGKYAQRHEARDKLGPQALDAGVGAPHVRK